RKQVSSVPEEPPMHDRALSARTSAPRPARSPIALSALALTIVACAAPHPQDGGEPVPAPVTATASAALQDVLEGPLVELSPSVKASDFRLSPPAVVDVQAARGPNGGSLVFVRFARDQRLGRQVVLPGDHGDLVLRDDGTG